MNGIDSLIDRYGIGSLHLFVRAYSAIGANDVANAIEALASAKGSSEDALSLANRLICERSGYDYQDIYDYVANHGLT
ncbi:MAG: hypothetical protein JO218_16350 [Burkholderiales bacterium]|nr:hypothetical protein [Burkholderiales bacterium]